MTGMTCVWGRLLLQLVFQGSKELALFESHIPLTIEILPDY